MHAFFALLLAVTQPWLLVSDIHLNPYDRSAQPAWYQNDTNAALFDAAVAQMRAAVPRPAVVVISGDFLAHQFAEKVRAAGTKDTVPQAAIAAMRRIERSFAAAFPQARFLIVLGNNDDPCGDYRTAPRTPYLAALARLWAPLVNRNGAAPQFARDFARWGSYTASLPGGARAIVVDDVYWSFVYRGCTGAPLNAPQLQMQWLTAKLGALRPGAHADVIMHIPPGVDPMTTLMTKRFVVVPYWNGGMLNRFTALMRANRRHIGLVIAGHTHRSDFRIAGGVPIMVAPAVSPIYSNNPGFAVLHVGDGSLQNYQLYSMDLDDGTWSRIFDFDALYGTRGFDTGALAAAHQAIAVQPQVRSQWVRSLAGGGSQADVDIGRDWKAYWCAQTQLGPGYTDCAGDRRRVTLAFSLAIVGTVVVLAALVWGGLRLARQRRRA